MFIYAIFFLFLGVILLFLASRQRKATGLPGGRVIYSDTSRWELVEKPLYDPQEGVSGKPDYLVKQAGMIIPVEVKSSRVSQKPYDSHIYQLAVYCYLVECEYKVRPSYGILHYPTQTFRIEYTPELEREMLDILFEIRTLANRKNIQRSHQVPQRCARCGYRLTCDQNLL